MNLMDEFKEKKKVGVNSIDCNCLSKGRCLNQDIEFHGCKLKNINYAIIKHVIISKKNIYIVLL